MLPLKKKEVDTIGLRPSGLLKKKNQTKQLLYCVFVYITISTCVYLKFLVSALST